MGDELLKEDGDRLLQEDGMSILTEEPEPTVTFNNYLFVRVGTGMGTTERIR